MRGKFTQILPPNPDNLDPRPLVNGDGIHAGESFCALFPDGWHDITLEVKGDGTWYISTPGYSRICPIGLFVKI